MYWSSGPLGPLGTKIILLLSSFKSQLFIRDINAIIHFIITGEQGGTWTMDLTKTSDWVKSGAEGSPKMTITVSDQDFVKIRQKQLNAQMAAMQGKLKFKPMDMGLAMKLGKLLS